MAANVLLHGVGGLNIDASRIGTNDNLNGGAYADSDMKRNPENVGGYGFAVKPGEYQQPKGRWPANVILDEYSAGLLDEQSGVLTSGAKKPWIYGPGSGEAVTSFQAGLEGKTRDYTADKSSGGASRFFYCAKASKRDRNEGLEDMEIVEGKRTHSGGKDTRGRPVPQNRNIHPTVKPTALMRYLIKLVTPAGGTVLDPFTGSGSTGKAALLDGYKFVGAELTEEYLPIIEGRLRWAYEQEADDETLF